MRSRYRILNQLKVFLIEKIVTFGAIINLTLPALWILYIQTWNLMKIMSIKVESFGHIESQIIILHENFDKIIFWRVIEWKSNI